MEMFDEKKLRSTMSSMDVKEHNIVSKIDHLKQETFCSSLDLETAKSFRDTDTSNRELQSPSIYKCQYPGLDNVVFIRGSGPHKILYGDKLGQSVKEIIVSRKCAEAVLRGAQVHKRNS